MAVALRTARLLLRQWRDEDVAAFAEMSADPTVMEYLLPLSERGLSAETWVAGKRAHWVEHGFGQWVVELPGATSFLGVVGLETVSYQAHFTPAVEVAWRLAHPFGAEATRPSPPGPRSTTASMSLGYERSSR